MKLKDILDFSLGNFLCLRGFAPMGDLYDISEADLGFQRDLLKEHEKEMLFRQTERNQLHVYTNFLSIPAMRSQA